MSHGLSILQRKSPDRLYENGALSCQCWHRSLAEWQKSGADAVLPHASALHLSSSHPDQRRLLLPIRLFARTVQRSERHIYSLAAFQQVGEAMAPTVARSRTPCISTNLDSAPKGESRRLQKVIAQQLIEQCGSCAQVRCVHGRSRSTIRIPRPTCAPDLFRVVEGQRLFRVRPGKPHQR
jgi:hypothetical protein